MKAFAFAVLALLAVSASTGSARELQQLSPGSAFDPNLITDFNSVLKALQAAGVKGLPTLTSTDLNSLVAAAKGAANAVDDLPLIPSELRTALKAIQSLSAGTIAPALPYVNTALKFGSAALSGNPASLPKPAEVINLVAGLLNVLAGSNKFPTNATPASVNGTINAIAKTIANDAINFAKTALPANLAGVIPNNLAEFLPPFTDTVAALDSANALLPKRNGTTIVRKGLTKLATKVKAMIPSPRPRASPSPRPRAAPAQLPAGAQAAIKAALNLVPVVYPTVQKLLKAQGIPAPSLAVVQAVIATMTSAAQGKTPVQLIVAAVTAVIKASTGLGR